MTNSSKVTKSVKRPSISFPDFLDNLEWEGGICGYIAYQGTQLPPMHETNGVPMSDLKILAKTWTQAAETVEELQRVIEDMTWEMEPDE